MSGNRERLPYKIECRLAGAGKTAGVYSKTLPRIPSRKTLRNRRVGYGVAEAAGEDVLIVVFVSVLFVVAGDGFTTVVLVSFFSPAGGFTVSVFSPQAASNAAAPTRLPMYF